MEDKLEDVIRQYEFTVKAKYRARGGTLLDTDKGLLLAAPLMGSGKHLQVEHAVTQHLQRQGYPDTDRIVCNREGGLSSKDAYKRDWVIRVHYQGEECNLRDEKQVAQAAANLAILHSKMTGIFPGEELCRPANHPERELLAVYTRHSREMKRVRTYIRGKNHKNEFEVAVLDSFESFFECAEKSLHMLAESGYENLYREAGEKGIYIHGSYTYHNILYGEEDTIYTTHFGRTREGMQVQDLYDLLRKTMEKNQWKPGIGMGLIDAYQKIRRLSREEHSLLYIQLLYPEKYWKILNFYYNNKKSWISSRNLQKLRDIQSQAAAKQSFLETVFL